MADMVPLWQCPMCSATVPHQLSQCVSCRAILTLSDLDALFNNGEVDQEQTRRAIVTFRNMARTQDDFNVQYHLGLAFSNLNRPYEALVAFRAAIFFRPNSKLLQAAVQKLEQRVANLEASHQDVGAKDQHSRPTILVVDDSRMQILFVSRVLEKHGWRVITAFGGAEALEKVRGVDLVFLDINMPRMDGYEVCKLIRENSETARIPVVLLSGQEASGDDDRARLAGADGYLTKPCKPELLLQAVEKHCQAACA
jgi:CheY-like chemotaxis protein